MCVCMCDCGAYMCVCVLWVCCVSVGGCECAYIYTYMHACLLLSHCFFTDTVPDPKNVQIRLVGGSSPNYGRVEVRYGGLWGTICNDHLHFKDAKVICRQLGYPVTVGVLARGLIEPGTGLIWLDNLHCSGDEKNIVDCKHPGWGKHDCSHSEDVGVMCACEFSRWRSCAYIHTYVRTCIRMYVHTCILT